MRAVSLQARVESTAQRADHDEHQDDHEQQQARADEPVGHHGGQVGEAVQRHAQPHPWEVRRPTVRPSAHGRQAHLRTHATAATPRTWLTAR